jgi:predicted nucleic-acid-binding Zn-ribbon protein
MVKNHHIPPKCAHTNYNFNRIQLVNMFVSTYARIRIWNNQRITITCSHLALIKILLLFPSCTYKNKANGDESVLTFEIYL